MVLRRGTERKLAEKKLMEQLDELNRFHKACIGRELQMHEIREENKILKRGIKGFEKHET